VRQRATSGAIRTPRPDEIDAAVNAANWFRTGTGHSPRFAIDNPVKLDEAAFQGTGTSGQPLGVIQGASTYSITETAIGAASSYAAFRAAVTRFLIANAASGPGSVNLLLRPEIFDGMDADLISATASACG
jgi:hypothetical protein